LFFAALFVMVEGLAEMGLIRMIADALAEIIVTIDIAHRQVGMPGMCLDKRASGPMIHYLCALCTLYSR
jgi:hypothetical protein